MTHWGWYWKVKMKHKPKALCSRRSFMLIDSFSEFKNKEAVQLIKESSNPVLFTIPRYELTATIQDDNSLIVQFNSGTYIIPVEAKSCNYGGCYYFFHCPECNARMRKLYCIKGKYLCRRCANLGYYSQWLSPSRRNLSMVINVKNYLEHRTGSMNIKPPWMKQYTFQKLRRKYVKYDEKHCYAVHDELREWYGEGVNRFLDPYDPPSDMCDAYVEWTKRSW